MDYSNVFHLVAGNSRKAKVPCVLIGGFAVNFYKVTRATRDVDFLITEADFKKIKDTLLEAGYREDFASAVTVRMSNKKEMLEVDFMIVDTATRDKILEDGIEAEVSGEKLIMPSVEHLIALKLHAIKNNPKNRLWKDLPDIIKLIRMNNVDFKSDKFKNLCLKFGNAEIYKHIINFLEGTL